MPLSEALFSWDKRFSRKEFCAIEVCFRAILLCKGIRLSCHTTCAPLVIWSRSMLCKNSTERNGVMDFYLQYGLKFQLKYRRTVLFFTSRQQISFKLVRNARDCQDCLLKPLLNLAKSFVCAKLVYLATKVLKCLDLHE